MEPSVKPLRIKLCLQEREPPTFAQKINMGTQDEEAEEEPADNLQRRQRRSDVEQQGDRSGPEKDNTPISRSEG